MLRVGNIFKYSMRVSELVCNIMFYLVYTCHRASTLSSNIPYVL